METIIQNIQRLQETKEAIKQALTNRGVSVSNSDTFYSYAEKIAAISSEKVNLNILDNIGNPVTEATVDIYYWDDKVESFTSTGATLTIYIPQYVYYTIKITYTKYKYEDISYTAINGNTRDINLSVFGVFICDNTGVLTTVNTWNTDNNSKSVGAAIIDDNYSFIIGKTNNNSIQWGGYGRDISELTNIEDGDQAKLDFNGKSNTDKIISLFGSLDSAATLCRSKTIRINGQTREGYLPALGELNIAYNNKSQITSALSKIRGTAMLDNYYWSSTEYSKNFAWALHWNYGSVFTHEKGNGGYCCPWFEY